MNAPSVSVDEAWNFLSQQTAYRPKIAFILGSGLSAVGDAFPGIEIPFADIPGMPSTTVTGHRGLLKVGEKALVFLGRFHHYEGYSFRTVAFPVFLMKKMGVEIVVLTNAAGGINPSYRPGDLVLLRDHINLMGGNPFVGPHDPSFGPRFFDMSEAYDHEAKSIFQKLAKSELGRALEEGIYAAMAGPNYETPAEIRFLRTIGADLVGMSTVPEALAARSCGLRLAAISCVTNLAAGLSNQPLDHAEVVIYSKKAESNLARLLKGFIASQKA